MSAAIAHAPDVRPIRSLVRTTRLALRSGTAVVGLGLTAGTATTALLLAVVADLGCPLVGPWVRATGLALLWVATGGVFIWKGLAPFARRLRDTDIARRIEGQIPGMHDRLVSCLDLADRTENVSPAFYLKLVAESLDRTGTYRPASVVDWQAVRRSLAFAVVSLGTLGVTGLALGDRFTTAVTRVFHPDADLPPVGDVAFTVEPGTTRVLSGQDITFSAVVTRGEPAGLTVELAGDGVVVRHPLEHTGDGAWQRTLSGLSAEKAFARGFTYRILGGGTWSREQRIDWAERPAVADVRVRVLYPPYLGIAEPRANPPGTRDATAPTGSTVEVVVETEGEVVDGDLQRFESRPRLLGLVWLPETTPVGTHPLRNTDGPTWIASFPLTGTGTYRIRLRNSVGHGNRPASADPRYAAVSDEPPTVFVERPGTDLVLSKPDRVPLQIVARDDYGLRDLWLAVQRDGEPSFIRAVRLKDYPANDPPAADGVVTSLDLTRTGLDLKPGQSLRYRVEVRDRRPDSESVVSATFAVRIATDPNSADKLLETFEKGHDAAREKLNNLVADQQKIKERIDAARSTPGESVRKELGDLAARERANAAAAARLEQELKALADTARQTPLVNGTIAKEAQRLGDGFRAAATDPLDDLAAKLKQEAASETPDLNDLQQRGGQVQRKLEALKGRMDALAIAQKGMKTDPEKALAQLRDSLLHEQGRSTARSLEELKDVLKALREDLANLQGKQENLADQTAKVKDPELPAIEKKQFSLDDLLKMDLEQAKKILDRERARRIEKKDLPTDPFQPALGGAKPKADAKGTNAARKDGPPPGRREALQDHQKDNLKNLDAAQKALASDEQTLEEMIQSLMNATQQAPKSPPKDGPPPKTSDALNKLLGSEAMKDAMQMAERAKQAKPGSPDQPLPSGATAGTGATASGPGSLDDLDPASRATILQLPPRVREELLQGMKAQGPEGYRQFIQDYFKRLSQGPR